jgi:hypothetical protein
MKEQADARLSDVRLERLPTSLTLDGWCLVAHGAVYDDKKGRFKNGSIVRTSIISEMKDGCIYTQNSVYEVI